MMRPAGHVRALLFLGALVPAGLPAADTVPLTLPEALARADGASPELAAARERAAAQVARADATGRESWPRLGLGSEWSRTDTPARVFANRLNSGNLSADDLALERLNSPGSLSHLTTSISLELPLDVFGKVRSRSDVEWAGSRALEAQAHEARQEVRLRVVEAFQRAALARSVLAVAEQALDGARSRERDLETRVEQGAALGADLLRARARRRERDAGRAEAHGNLGVALAALARAVGAAPGTVFEPVGTLEPPSDEGSLADWQQRGLTARGSVLAARERRGASGLALRAEQRSRLPDLAASFQVQDDRGTAASAGSYAAGVALRWSPFDPARGKRVAAAAAEERAAANEERAAADDVRFSVEAAWRRLGSARARLAAAAGGTEEAREALRVVQERQRAGKATLTDELETEAAWRAAELAEMAAAAEVALADAALRRAAGVL
jgi:outer membrane protein